MSFSSMIGYSRALLPLGAALLLTQCEDSGSVVVHDPNELPQSTTPRKDPSEYKTYDSDEPEYADGGPLATLARSRSRRNRLALAEWATGIQAYRALNEGALPSNLELVAAAGHLESPASELAWVDPENADHYTPFYLAAQVDLENPKSILLAGALVSPGELRDVAFLDGTTAELPEADFQARASVVGALGGEPAIKPLRSSTPRGNEGSALDPNAPVAAPSDAPVGE